MPNTCTMVGSVVRAYYIYSAEVYIEGYCITNIMD